LGLGSLGWRGQRNTGRAETMAAPECFPTLDPSAARHLTPPSRRARAPLTPPSTPPFGRATRSSRQMDSPGQVSSLSLPEERLDREGPRITVQLAGSLDVPSAMGVLGRQVWRVWTTSPFSHLKAGRMCLDLYPARHSADCLLGRGVQASATSMERWEGIRGLELESTLATCSSSLWRLFTQRQPSSPH